MKYEGFEKLSLGFVYCNIVKYANALYHLICVYKHTRHIEIQMP